MRSGAFAAYSPSSFSLLTSPAARSNNPARKWSPTHFPEAVGYEIRRTHAMDRLRGPPRQLRMRGMDQPTYSSVQQIVERSGTLLFSFQELDSTKPPDWPLSFVGLRH
jgi:hypothetical protein